MRIFLLIFIILTLSHRDLWSQSKQVVLCGSIEYERRIAIKKKMIASLDEDEPNFFMEEYIKKAPVEVVDVFKLNFKQTESLYQFSNAKVVSDFELWGHDDIANKNTVYKNLNNNQRISQKQLYENSFLLTDTLKKFDWKITGEIREIAGYECRKATTIINDSLYVIAFYTEDIVCNSGPESFSGLPGMILGVVMPRLHTTWFASKVVPFCDENLSIKSPTKGKQSTEPQLLDKLKERFGKYKKWYASMVWGVVI